MKKTIVIYYSLTGSNAFLAGQIAQRINCDTEAIRPVINVHLLMLMGIGLGIRSLQNNLAAYEQVILCGPIWMGKFIYPLKQFVKKYGHQIRELQFITCCGSSDQMKEEKFGHGLVFRQIQKLLPETRLQCTAFPIPLILTSEQLQDDKKVMETRLNAANFNGKILDRFNEFMHNL